MNLILMLMLLVAQMSEIFIYVSEARSTRTVNNKLFYVHSTVYECMAFLSTEYAQLDARNELELIKSN